MRYRNETPDKMSVKEVVQMIFLKRGRLDATVLAERVRKYYLNEKGISSERLNALIDMYCEEVIREQINDSYHKLVGNTSV